MIDLKDIDNIVMSLYSKETEKKIKDMLKEHNKVYLYFNPYYEYRIDKKVIFVTFKRVEKLLKSDIDYPFIDELKEYKDIKKIAKKIKDSY